MSKKISVSFIAEDLIDEFHTAVYETASADLQPDNKHTRKVRKTLFGRQRAVERQLRKYIAKLEAEAPKTIAEGNVGGKTTPADTPINPVVYVTLANILRKHAERTNSQWVAGFRSTVYDLNDFQRDLNAIADLLDPPVKKNNPNAKSPAKNGARRATPY